MPHPSARSCLLFLLSLVLAGRVIAAESLGVEPDAVRRVLTNQLESPHWTDRAFGLLRLERYEGEEVTALLHAGATDDAWQVRCFAIRQTHRMGLPVTDLPLSAERDVRVIRCGLRYGYTFDVNLLERLARRRMRGQDPDTVILGLEIAAASGNDGLRREAARRLKEVAPRIDEVTALRYGRRLGRVAGLDESSRHPATWREWTRRAGRTPELPLPRPPAPELEPAIVAALPTDAFSRFVDYLDALRHEDLEMAIALDATRSMEPMINEARAGVESLILFFDDIAQSMRIGIVAYRDHDNLPVTESSPLTTDVAAVRRFLFDLAITGGRDLPEAVLEGFLACGRLQWREGSSRRIVLVGDARPHETDLPEVHAFLDLCQEKHVVVDVAYIPQRIDVERLPPMSPEALETYRGEVDLHNADTATAFQSIADRGGGAKVTMQRAEELVPSLMHFAIEEAWWPAFDEFYAVYLDLCR